MDPINLVVSENLKRLRERKKMSLDAVAKLSGVSKSMLGQIERGDVNPTISTVWKIANGLKVPFSELISQPESDCEVIDFSALTPLVEDDGHYRGYVVFPFEEHRHFEVLYLELDPGSRLESEPHPQGTQELVTVFSGELAVRVNNATLTAKANGAIRFAGDRVHEYQNIGCELCRLSMVLVYST